MATHTSRLTGSPGCRWLMLAAEMAGLVNGGWRPASGLPAESRAYLPRLATRSLGADTGAVRTARDFTVTTLRRWGTAERSQDIAIVVSELLTNALRHAVPVADAIRPRLPIRLGLLDPGSFVLCAVADPGQAVPVPRAPGSLAETGRGLHIIRALSDQWGYTTPTEAGKVVWAVFTLRLPVPSPARYPSRPVGDRVPETAR